MPLSLLSVPGTPGAIGWRPGSVAAPGQAGQADDLGGGRAAWLDVAHKGPRDLCRVLAMISCSGTFGSPRWVAEEWRSWCSPRPPLVVAVSSRMRAGRSPAGTAGLRADVTQVGGARRCGPGQRLDRNSGPRAGSRPAIRRGSRWACGAPGNPNRVAALGGDPGLFEVQLLDVECQDRAGAAGGLVEHPPQRLLPQGHVPAGHSRSTRP